jgi:hypothetical protein
VVLLFTLLVVVPWLIRHPPDDRHVSQPIDHQPSDNNLQTGRLPPDVQLSAMNRV